MTAKPLCRQDLPLGGGGELMNVLRGQWGDSVQENVETPLHPKDDHIIEEVPHLSDFGTESILLCCGARKVDGWQGLQEQCIIEA